MACTRSLSRERVRMSRFRRRGVAAEGSGVLMRAEPRVCFLGHVSAFQRFFDTANSVSAVNACATV